MDTRMFDALKAVGKNAFQAMAMAMDARTLSVFLQKEEQKDRRRIEELMQFETASQDMSKAIAAIQMLQPEPRAYRRRMTGRKAKAPLNQRQLWRRRRANGRGIKGGARK